MTSQEDKPKSFMHLLDEWTNATVIEPLYRAYSGDGSDDAFDRAEEAVRKAMREKVLESYHNGQKADPRKAHTPKRRPYGV